MITNHSELINELIEKYEFKSYLEIGVQNPVNNFYKIKCQYKRGVDPEPNLKGISEIWNCTSDEYFLSSITQFDLVFIDGLHHWDQVKKDFENSLKRLNFGGVIVIHDTLPENEEGTIVPRQSKVWWGDVYKFAMGLSHYKGIKFITYNIDNGCTVVTRSDQDLTPTTITPNWLSYQSVGRYILNVSNEVEI